MDNKVVVYGAGGHGKVVAEIVVASGRTLDGFIDDNSALSATSVIGVPVFAAMDWLALHPGATVLLGIGDNCARARTASLVKRHGCKLAIAVHPAATVARCAKLAEGTVVMPAAVLNPDCEIGEGAIINSGAIVEHDVHIDRYAHLSPNCAVAGGARIGAYSHIGIGASVLPLKRVGANCIVGAGAVVIDDIADNQVVFGVPAKVQL
jgi:sugar O-acyltransferase (sialic acid O-acetyltransferase NeuD family)